MSTGVDISKLRLVEVPDAPIVLGWAEPESIDENPLNWKIHTDFQTEIVSELIRKHGWIKPLIYNRQTARLLDGHDRRKIALAMSMPFVPVIIGDWPEEQEPEIIASLDPSGALAKSDPKKLDEVMRQFADPAPIIQDMMTRLAESEGVLAYLKRDSKGQGSGFVGDETGRSGGDGGGDRKDDDDEHQNLILPTSHVRMVQLFFTIEQYPEFRELVDDLAEVFDTGPDTDTVLACLREVKRTRVTESDLLD